MTVTATSGLVRDWAYRALSGLGDARAEIDALNVYPVPDGDTGSNMLATVIAISIRNASFAGPRIIT